MYKVIAEYTPYNASVIQTKVFTYNKQDEAVTWASMLKVRLLETGAKVISIRVYKVKEIDFTEKV